MKNKFLTVLLILNLIVTCGILTYLFQNNEIQLDFSDEVIQVRGLVVTDSLGVERVIIGSPLPPPQSHGFRFDRGNDAQVSGIMLYDSEGQERSGYVTDDGYGNVFFTLDSKTHQRALFVAEPQGATTLKIWGFNGNQLEMGSSDDGTWLRATKNGKEYNFIED